MGLLPYVKKPLKEIHNEGNVPAFTALDYTKFFSAGAICCTATHGGMTPVDVIKTSIQIRDDLKGKGLVTAGRTIVAEGGPKALLRGFGPTAYGYLLQGGAKFAGYEFWKRRLVLAAGGYDAAVQHRTAIYLASASIAEFFADILLTPMEATRIRLVSQKNYASGFLPAFTRMMREEGFRGAYAGFLPILCKQIPYAVGQFTVNEWAHEAVEKQLGHERVASMGTLGHTGVTLGCGIVAGVAASYLSQPADTLLSKINKGGGGSGSILRDLWTLAKKAGPRGLFAGSVPRCVMTCGLVSGQFLMYGGIKSALNAGHGVEIHKAGS